MLYLPISYFIVLLILYCLYWYNFIHKIRYLPQYCFLISNLYAIAFTDWVLRWQSSLNLLVKVLASGKNSTIWAVVWVAEKRLKEVLFINLINELLANKRKLAKVELNCYLDIGIHLDIAKYFNIAKRIFENIKLSMRDKSWNLSEKKYTKVFSCFLFLLTRYGLVA